MVQVTQPTKSEVQALVAGCFFDLAKQVDGGFIPMGHEPERELNWRRHMSEEAISHLSDQLATHKHDGTARCLAREQLAARGYDLDDLSCSGQADVLTGVTRALLEQQRLFLFRLEERLLPYEPADPLFQGAINCNVLPPSPPKEAGPSSPMVGPSLGEVAEKYLAAGRTKWTPKTFKARQQRMSNLVEHLGAETAIAAISPHQIRGFRDAVLRLRRNCHLGAGQTFLAKQTENEKQRIAPRTAELQFETCKAFFRWAEDHEGYMATNPAEHVRVDVPKGPKGLKSRRPFTADELSQLFDSPVFTGCQSAKRRFQHGDVIVKDAQYWIPLLGFFTGARLGEIVQLHIEDVHLEGPIPFLRITDANSGEIGTDDHKHVKTTAGVRDVPLHPDLMTLGFGDFISRRRKEKRSSKRVFWAIAFGADGQASTVFSKWFSRFLDKAGLTDPALVFHSFRHNAEDALRNALLPPYVIDRVIGHTEATTSSDYGDGNSLETVFAAVKAMKFKIDLLPRLT